MSGEEFAAQASSHHNHVDAPEVHDDRWTEGGLARVPRHIVRRQPAPSLKTVGTTASASEVTMVAAASRVEPKVPSERWGRRFGVVASLVFLLPHVLTIVSPHEEFPFTSAPMFAHYLGEATPRYRFLFTAEFDDSRSPQEVRGAQLGVAGVEFTRYFFGKVYRSIDPDSPFTGPGSDTPAAFEGRMTTFLGRMAAVLQRRDPVRWRGLQRLRLEVVRMDARNHPVDVHEVGVYQVSAGRFFHTWRSHP
jgi:hypothetical protein